MGWKVGVIVPLQICLVNTKFCIEIVLAGQLGPCENLLSLQIKLIHSSLREKNVNDSVLPIWIKSSIEESTHLGHRQFVYTLYD